MSHGAAFRFRQHAISSSRSKIRVITAAFAETRHYRFIEQTGSCAPHSRSLGQSLALPKSGHEGFAWWKSTFVGFSWSVSILWSWPITAKENGDDLLTP